ncbi:MAG: glycosyltransferase [Bacteroidales bacterium]|nr:glycosyltransferase [Bacteroidales bacterium]
MPCYNAEHFISQSIESVISQTYQNWELIVTDDFSFDFSLH